MKYLKYNYLWHCWHSLIYVISPNLIWCKNRETLVMKTNQSMAYIPMVYHFLHQKCPIVVIYLKHFYVCPNFLFRFSSLLILEQKSTIWHFGIYIGWRRKWRWTSSSRIDLLYRAMTVYANLNFMPHNMIAFQELPRMCAISLFIYTWVFMWCMSIFYVKRFIVQLYLY